MTLYWLTIAALLAAVVLSVHGGVAAAAAAPSAGSAFWLRFHTRLALGASVACVLFAIVAAPVAATL